MGLTVDRNDPAGRERRTMGQNKTSEARIFRSTDGKLVGENDPRAATLAYAVGSEVPSDRVAEYDAFMNQADEAEIYPAADPADRARLREKLVPSGTSTATNTQPIGERLATEIADDAQRIANSDVDTRVAEAEAADPDRVVARVRVYRTEAGDLVGESDPDAFTLAYAEGDEIVDPAHKRAYRDMNKVVDEVPEGQGPEGADTDPSTVEGETPTPPDQDPNAAKDADTASTTPATATKATKAPANKAAGTPADK